MYIYNLVWIYFEFFDYFVVVNVFIFYCVEYFDFIVYELYEIFVVVNDSIVFICVVCLIGEGGDDVVGFKVFDFFVGDVEGMCCVVG